MPEGFVSVKYHREAVAGYQVGVYEQSQRADAAEARYDALVADLRELAGDWNRLMGWPRNVGAPALAFVLDKHAGDG